MRVSWILKCQTAGVCGAFLENIPALIVAPTWLSFLFWFIIHSANLCPLTQLIRAAQYPEVDPTQPTQPCWFTDTFALLSFSKGLVKRGRCLETFLFSRMMRDTCCTASPNTHPTNSNSFLIYSCVLFRSGLCCTTRPFPPCCGSGWQPGTFINRWPRSLLRTRTGIHLRPQSSRYWSKHRFPKVFLLFNFVVSCVKMLQLYRSCLLPHVLLVCGVF